VSRTLMSQNFSCRQPKFFILGPQRPLAVYSSPNVEFDLIISSKKISVF
jgi:hypothetical protein